MAMQRPASEHDSLRDLVRRSTNLALPMGALHALAELKVGLRELEADAIEAARTRGATWVDIARALGISRQALHQRMAATATAHAAPNELET
jgi:DNA-binding NtrC family response regulator